MKTSHNVPKLLVTTESIDGLAVTTCMVVHTYTVTQPDYSDKHPEEYSRIKAETEARVKSNVLQHVIQTLPSLLDSINN